MRKNDNFVNGKEKIKKLKKIIAEKDKALNEKNEIIKTLMILNKNKDKEIKELALTNLWPNTENRKK